MTWLSLLSLGLKLLGLTDWAEKLYQKHLDQQAGAAIQDAKDKAATIEEVDKINAVTSKVQNMSHAQLVADYARLHDIIISQSSK